MALDELKPFICKTGKNKIILIKKREWIDIYKTKQNSKISKTFIIKGFLPVFS